ncbi:hypothetical protein EC957_008273 [Mortierella hygrophila]|uniref:F-box domain-containing protein n=1 Tax=Mortierella hygrophila TaxID=979708 RepID=A0A9P6EWC0_9FUNG|nr:hypothetical protein EC957_008273 [Mortierella hygrophila]
MDPFITLPLECFQPIIQNLVDTNDVAALTALLQVNKYFATITLPFLYTVPFRDSYHARPPPGRETTNLAVSNRLMARVLLSRVLASASGNHVDEPAARLLSIVFDINITTTNNSDNIDNNDNNNSSVRNREVNKASSLDYLSHIRQLDGRNLFPGLYGPFATLSPDLTAFIRGDDFFTLAQLDHLPPTYEDDFLDQGELCQHSLSAVVNRIVHWTIAFPILEQLEVIVLPISNIGRYLDNVGRFGSLRRVIVSMDKVFECEQRGVVGGGDLDRVQVWEVFAASKQEAMDKLVQFFTEHTRIFPGCLQAVEYHPGDIGDPFYQRCPEKVKIQVIGLLPPLLRPSVLSAGNWERFFAHPEETDLSCVKYVETGPPQGRVFDLIRRRKEFLKRCRALRHLRMACLGEGTFQWAVKEKQELERLQGNITNFYYSADKQGAGATIIDEVTPRPLYSEHGLVPPAQVFISGVSSTTDELDDIVFAFSHTLESLTVHFRTGQESTISYIGYNWTVGLPALTHLTISTWNRLKINRYLLTRCPNLVSVEIFDSNSSQYHCREILPCASAQLAKLETINLLGWSSLTFHPDTLYSTGRLVSLTISVPYASSIYCYIPPVEELDRSYGVLQGYSDLGTEATTGTSAEAIGTPEAAIVRPEWRWDWHLPHLTKLELSGEYAFRFQFRMLKGCPSLKALDLNMITESLTHLVVLTEADFFMPQQDSCDCSSTPSATTTTPPLLPPRERIMAPELQMLTVRGSWLIDDAVMAQFLSRTTFPRLKCVTAKAWIGFSWVGLTNAVRTRATSATTTASSIPSTATASSSSPLTTPTTTTVGPDTLEMIKFEGEDPTPEERRDAGIVDIECVDMQQSRRREDCLAVGIQLQYLYNVLRVLDNGR